MEALRALLFLLAVPSAFLLAGCGNSNDEITVEKSDSLSVKTLMEEGTGVPDATPTEDPDSCAGKEHTGISRYGDNCQQTHADGYCMTHGLAFAVDGSGEICTNNDRSGCTLTNSEACPCSCKRHIDAHEDNQCGDSTTDHAGVSKYGTTCQETFEGGHCGSMGLSWTPHGEEGTECTMQDNTHCKLTNAQACCLSCKRPDHGCGDSTDDHPGRNRYDETCEETKAAGHCHSTRLSWTPVDSVLNCTHDDTASCSLTNEMACCGTCVADGPAR